MKIEKEILDSHEAKLIVTVEPEQLEDAKQRAARQLSKKYKIAGFRPGKAPYAVVLKHLGEGAITEQAVEHLIDEIYPKAIEETEISPYGPGALEEIPEMDPPCFHFRVPLAPEVELSAYRELRVDYEPKEVTDEDIQKVLDNIRDSQATIEQVERAVKEGDMVYVILNGERKGEEDPEKKQLIKDRRYPLIIEKKDSDTSTEYPFSGFSRKLIGLQAGDEKTFEHKFKKDYEFEDLRGVTAEYHVKIEEVKGRTLPEVTDEFAKSLGEYESVEALMNEIKNSLTDQNEADEKAAYDDQIMEKLLESTKIKFPPQMLEDEIDDFIHGLEHQLANQGLTMEVYLNSRSLTVEELREEVKESAETRLKRSLILMEIANTEEIQVTAENIDTRVRKTLDDVTAYYSEDEAKRLGTGKNLQNLINRIATDEVINQTLQRLRDIAMGKDIDTDQNLEAEEDASNTEVEQPGSDAEAPAVEAQPEPESAPTTEEE